MDRINGAGHLAHKFVTEDVSQGRPPTEITAEWLNGVQEELVHVIESAGITPNISDNSQLLTALSMLLAVSAASESTQGKTRFATIAETLAGLSSSIATHPAGVLALVNQKVAALVNSSPTALNTIDKLAAALGNDPNFATTITNFLAAKAPKEAPVFTGNVQVPNLAADEYSSKAANAKFVRDVMGKFGIGTADLYDFSGDLNTLYESGLYIATGANAPGGAAFVVVMTNAANTSCQIAIPQTGNEMYFRTSNSGAWSGWYRTLKGDSPYILGGVTHDYTGAGLFENITLNSSGTYVGRKIKLATASAVALRAHYEDTANENGIIVASRSTVINTDGSCQHDFVVTPPGSRTVDRRMTAMSLGGDGSVNVYNGRLLAKSGSGGTNNPNNCGYSFIGDTDTGWFNPTDGYLHGFVNGENFFEASPIGVRKFNFGLGNAYSISMQYDGNFVVYDGSSNVKFSANDFAHFYAGVKAPIGWRKLPDGTIEQWGYVNNPGSGSGTVTLPTSFPNAIWNIQITRKTPSSDFWPVQVNGTPTLSSFPWSQTGNNVNTSFYWRALGI